jgi:predicted DNA-binding transcriptional regulator YafY
MAKKRTETERRTRQSERLAKLLRLLQLISGAGRWDAEALAKELEVSIRTVHRLLQTLTFASVPWTFDPKLRAYRVARGFRLQVAGISGDEESKDGAKQRSQRIHAKIASIESKLDSVAEDLTEIAELLSTSLTDQKR